MCFMPGARRLGAGDGGVVGHAPRERRGADRARVADARLRVASTVLTMKLISPFLIMSTMCGRPSATLFTSVTGNAVRLDHRRGAARGEQREAELDEVARHLHRGELVAVAHADERAPAVGSFTPAASCDLTNASPKVSPTPITSPVDFISGPRMVSTPGKRANGNTASFTEKYGGVDFLDALLLQRLARHAARRDHGERQAGRLGHVRHGARGARVHFEHVHRVASGWRTARSSGPSP